MISILDVISKCRYCELCQDFVRSYVIDMIPHNLIEMISYDISNQYLNIKCSFNNGLIKNRFQLKIDCQSNKFNIISFYNTNIIDIESILSEIDPIYITIDSNCMSCNRSFCLSSDILLNLESRQLKASISFEVFYIDIYSISYFYKNQEMTINSCMDDHTISLPLIKFDFSDELKAVKKIKNIITLS